MTIRLHSDRMGDMISQRVFMTDGGGEREVGALWLAIGEWQLFGAALLLGADRTNGHLQVETSGWTPSTAKTVT